MLEVCLLGTGGMMPLPISVADVSEWFVIMEKSTLIDLWRG